MKKLIVGIMLMVTLMVTTCTVCHAQIISHFAGGTNRGWSGDGGPASTAEIFYPFNMESDAAGNLYFSELGNHIIRKVDINGIISTISGIPLNAGFSGDGGPAKAAKLNNPVGIAVSKNGVIYIGDWLNHRIRKIDAAGIITTIAGTGNSGYSGDGGMAINAKLNLEGAMDLVLDSKGNLYISQPESFVVRKIDPAGIITTVIGNGIKGYGGDNGNAFNAQLTQPSGLAIDKNDNIYVADPGSNTVRKITQAGIITTFAGSPGNGYSGDGGPATNAKFQIGSPIGLAVDGCGNVYIADYSNHVIRKVDPAGIISTVAGNNIGNVSGDGGPATSASIWFPGNVAVDPSNNLYIPDSYNNTIRKVTNPGAPIISHPKDLTLCPKSIAKFSVQSSANDSYSWEFNKGSGWQKLSDGADYSGTLSSTLSVTINDYAFDRIQYRCIINNACGNITSNAATLYVPADAAPASVTIAPDKMEVCEGTKIIFNPTILNEGSATTYEWIVNGASTNIKTKQFESASLKNGDKVILYVITNSNNACSSGAKLSSNEIAIRINSPSVKLPADTVLCEGSSLIIRPDQHFNSYRWSDGSTNDTYTVSRAGTYAIEVTDANKCKASDSVVVNYHPCTSADKYFAMPNAFTPNGDGINDIFRPKIPGEITGYRFAIYNRWGQIIFETRDRNKVWNGGRSGMQGSSNASSNTFSNTSSNTYTWICLYTDDTGKKITRKGSVLVIR